MADLFKDAKDIIELKLINDYVSLNNDNGDPNLQLINERFQNKNGFILFYSPSCGYCKQMAPEWKKLSSIVKDKIPVAAINCMDSNGGNDLLADYFRISGYPTIKYYKDGKYIDYTGGRDTKQLLNYLCKANGLCSF
jgi:thiol-disulfide isomerase/thioredoxin